MTFEERINRLEEIAAALESDEAELAASVRLFEEGVTLVRLAAEELRVAAGEVKLLREQMDGSLELVDIVS